MTNAIQTGRLACLWCFISSVCKTWRCWCSQKSWLREDTKCCGDLRPGCLGTLFHCFAYPTHCTRNSLLTALWAMSEVPLTLCSHIFRKHSKLFVSIICLYRAEYWTKQNLCMGKWRQAEIYIYKLIKQWMLETRTASNPSLQILHVKISRTKGTTENKFWSMMGPHFSNCHIVKAKLFSAQVSNTILCPTIHKGKIMLPSIYQQLWAALCQTYLEFSSVLHDPLPNLLRSCSFDDQIARVLLRSTEEMKGKLWLFPSSLFCLFQEAKSSILPFDHIFSRKKKKKEPCTESKVALRFIQHGTVKSFHDILSHDFH